MKTSKRLLSALLALVLLLTPVMMTPVEAAEKSASSNHTLYVFDMEEFLKNKGYGQVPYDYLKFATALQGLANRERPQVFFYSIEGSVNTETGVDIDDVWLKYITDPNNNSNILQNGEDISKYKIEHIDGTMNNFWALVTRFRGYADGLVLWDGDVGATANVASTIAGAEDLLPVRYALGHDDLYTQLMNGMGGKWTVKRSLVGLFDGKTIPTFESSNPGAEREVDTSLESTYSKKNDPYIWAIEHYLKKGKTNANLMTYSIDGSSDDFRQINPDHPIDAYIYQRNIPDVMQAGSYVPVELTVRNTGKIAWQMTDKNTWPNPVRLAKVDEATYSHSEIKNGNGTWQDWLNYHATHFQMVANDKEFDTTTTGGLTGIPANPCGGRASRLDIKNRVEVGEEYTFKFMLKAPTKPGLYQFDLRMLQDTANANFPAGIFSNVYHVSVDVIDGRVEHNESQMFDAEDSADFLCAYDATLHTEKGKGAYDVTKNLEALQAHMVYPMRIPSRSSPQTSVTPYGRKTPVMRCTTAWAILNGRRWN
ncbi:MAG: hypothetical protein IIV87_04075 [Oscillospiraceae bacterium]|nr:hypothetical protein [Oscillospiraceae bacterium]